MNKRMVSIISILLLIVLAGTLLASCGSSSSPTPTSTGGSTGGSTADGRTLMQTRCTVCHSADRITSSHKTTAQWKATVDHMISNGAQLTTPEEQTLINYLAQNYK
jgi:cytochrome c5